MLLRVAASSLLGVLSYGDRLGKTTYFLCCFALRPSSLFETGDNIIASISNNGASSCHVRHTDYINLPPCHRVSLAPVDRKSREHRFACLHDSSLHGESLSPLPKQTRTVFFLLHVDNCVYMSNFSFSMFARLRGFSHQCTWVCDWCAVFSSD